MLAEYFTCNFIARKVSLKLSKMQKDAIIKYINCCADKKVFLKFIAFKMIWFKMIFWFKIILIAHHSLI